MASVTGQNHDFSCGSQRFPKRDTLMARISHVKRAKGSTPLSHLFSQALVSTQALATSPQARERFAAKVRNLPKGRDIQADFVPKKVVLAILLKDGEDLTPDTLFPFSQVTLATAARELESRYQIPIEVIGIEADAR